MSFASHNPRGQGKPFFHWKRKARFRALLESGLTPEEYDRIKAQRSRDRYNERKKRAKNL